MTRQDTPFVLLTASDGMNEAKSTRLASFFCISRGAFLISQNQLIGVEAKSSKREKGIGWAHTTNTRRTWLHYQIIIIMIYGGWIGAFQGKKSRKPFLLSPCLVGVFYLFHYLLFFFFFCIALHNGLPANARPLYPGTLECLLVLFFYNLFFRLFLYCYKFGWG